MFTADVDRAREVAGRIGRAPSGTTVSSRLRDGFGGFKQSGVGREGGREGLLPFLESKAMMLDGPTSVSDVRFFQGGMVFFSDPRVISGQNSGHLVS